MRILIIDDEEFFANNISRFLMKISQAEVDYAISVAQALACVRENSYDLIISDVRLPDSMDGELIFKINQMKPAQAFIIMSAYEIPRQLLNQKEINIFAVLEKPFDMSELQNKISIFANQSTKQI